MSANDEQGKRRANGAQSQGLRNVKGNPSPNPMTLSGSSNDRVTHYSDEYLDTEDDPIPTPPRLPSTAIRRSMQAGSPPRPTAASSPSPVPQRRATAIPQQPGTSFNPPASTLPVPRNTTKQQPLAVRPPKEKEPRRIHWLLYVGIGMIAMLVLWLVGVQAVAWGTAKVDDFRYGNPRTFQIDKYVGHGDSPDHPSHFIAINLHGQVIVLEFPGGSAGATTAVNQPVNASGTPTGTPTTDQKCNCFVYVVANLIETGSDLVPVTLEFRDVTGDNKPDMLVHIADKIIVWVNDGTQFRVSTKDDHIHL